MHAKAPRGQALDTSLVLRVGNKRYDPTVVFGTTRVLTWTLKILGQNESPTPQPTRGNNRHAQLSAGKQQNTGTSCHLLLQAPLRSPHEACSTYTYILRTSYGAFHRYHCCRCTRRYSSRQDTYLYIIFHLYIKPFFLLVDIQHTQHGRLSHVPGIIQQLRCCISTRRVYACTRKYTRVPVAYEHNRWTLKTLDKTHAFCTWATWADANQQPARSSQRSLSITECVLQV